MNELSITDIGSILALILSVFGILYTRKNIKLTKYIETITNQRIKWIDVLRDDFAKILSLASIFNDKMSLYKMLEDIEKRKFYANLSLADKKQLKDIKKIIGENYTKIRENASNSESIKTIEIAILRLNSKDDSVLISLLEKLKKSFTTYNMQENVINDQFIIEMRNEMKKLLKNEWEKVKDETIKGRESNEQKDNWF